MREVFDGLSRKADIAATSMTTAILLRGVMIGALLVDPLRNRSYVGCF